MKAYPNHEAGADCSGFCVFGKRHEEEGAWMQAPIEVSPRGVEKCFFLTSSLQELGS